MVHHSIFLACSLNQLVPVSSLQFNKHRKSGVPKHRSKERWSIAHHGCISKQEEKSTPCHTHTQRRLHLPSLFHVIQKGQEMNKEANWSPKQTRLTNKPKMVGLVIDWKNINPDRYLVGAKRTWSRPLKIPTQYLSFFTTIEHCYSNQNQLIVSSFAACFPPWVIHVRCPSNHPWWWWLKCLALRVGTVDAWCRQTLRGHS